VALKCGLLRAPQRVACPTELCPNTPILDLSSRMSFSFFLTLALCFCVPVRELNEGVILIILKFPKSVLHQCLESNRLKVWKQDFRWATLLRRDGGLRAPTQRAPETLHRRPSAAAIAAPEGCRFQLSLNRNGPLDFSCVPCIVTKYCSILPKVLSLVLCGAKSRTVQYFPHSALVTKYCSIVLTFRTVP